MFREVGKQRCRKPVGVLIDFGRKKKQTKPPHGLTEVTKVNKSGTFWKGFTKKL